MPLSSLARRLARLLCALLVFAQSVALLHASWHASHEVRAGNEIAYAAQSDHRAPGSPGFCSFDAALGQLLTGGAAPYQGFAPSTADEAVLLPCSRTFAAGDRLAPRSRGPPPSA